MSRPTVHLPRFLAAAALALAGAAAATARAAFVTTSTYDPATANDVDRSAAFVSGTAGTSAANVLTIAQFRTVLAAASTSSGGVIDFETAAGSLDSSTAFSGTYAGGAKSVTFARPASDTTSTFSIGSAGSGNRVATSGASYLAKGGNDDWNFAVSSLTGGAAGEGVTAFGITILQRDANNGSGNAGDGQATATFTNGTDTVSVVAGADLNFTTASGPNTVDTFYGFAAPGGYRLVSVVLPVSAFLAADDLGFVTAAVPEPAAASAAAAGFGTLLLRTARRRHSRRD